MGGPPPFVETLRRHLPQREDEAVKALVRDWREIGRGDDPAWLRPLIEHIYGGSYASTIWNED